MAFPDDPLLFKVEAGYGADLTVDPSGWSWTDETLRARKRIVVNAGRQDWSSEVDPGRSMLGLGNTDARFTPRNPTSPVYPYVRRNLPLRVQVNPGSGWAERFTHYLEDVQLVWPGDTEDVAEAHIRTAGILHRLEQGKALRSALYRETVASNPAAYWPLEDGTDAPQAASAVVGNPPMVGDLKLGGTEGPGGSGPVVDTDERGSLFAAIPHRAATAYRVECVAQVSAQGPGAGSGPTIIQWSAPGDVTLWRIVADDTGPWGVQYFDGTITTLVGTIDAFDGNWHHLRVDVEDDGADVDVTLYVDGAVSDTWTLSATSFNWPLDVGLLTFEDVEDQALPKVGHIAIWAGLPVTSTDEAAHGWPTEEASARIARICAEEGIAATITPGTSAEMGAQPRASIGDILQDCATTDAGYLYETGAGVGYIPRTAQYNRPVDLALDCRLPGQVRTTPEPVYDTDRLRNDITASQPRGSSATYADVTGPLGTQAMGRPHSAPAEVNVADASTLHSHAAWRVGLGTVEEPRYETISLDLKAAPGLIPAWLAAGIGARVTVTGLPSQSDAEDLDLLIEGYTETLDAVEWTVDLICSPFRPYIVGVLEGSGAPDEPVLRLETGGSRLHLGVDDDHGTLLVQTTGTAPWTTDAVYPDDFPFDVEALGEQIQVDGITTNAATFVAVGTLSEGSNAPRTPALPAGIQAGDVLLCLAAIRNSGTGTVDTIAGWEVLAEFGNVKLQGIVYDGVMSAPTVNFTGGVANATNHAQIAAFRNLSLTVHNSATQLNSSAQNIARPALAILRDRCVGIYIGWKQDDATTVSTPSGATKIATVSTTTGDDAVITWDYVIQTTATDIASASYTVTGGASAISRGIVLALQGDIQTFDVTRAANGVVKAHAAGTPISLWRPPVLAL